MIELSVVVPTRNRANILFKALESIVNQTLRQERFEVIVVDNGSTDSTKKIVDSFTGKIENLVYIYDDNPGLHIGRHRGLLAAKSNLLTYCDDDIEAFTTWLEGVLESFKDDNVVLVGGKNLPNFESPAPRWITEMWNKDPYEKVIASLSVLDLGNEIKEISPYYVFGCNFSIRKSTLYEAGGFHPDGMPQDLLRYRGDGESHVSKYILEKGYRVVYNPKASVYHLCSLDRMTKEYFERRAYNQAVSDSYSSIREGRKGLLLKNRIRFIINNFILMKSSERERSYLSGLTFHQNEVKNDKNLQKWIERESYIENGMII
jgi:glucosyl-dolichyl phosphate glucuronosyltransferase